MTSGLPVVRRMCAEDIPIVVDIHMRAFPSFFLSILGRDFLVQLYRGFGGTSSAVALVAVEGDLVVGSVAGTASPQGFFRGLVLNNWWGFARASLGTCIRRPSTIPRIVRALGYRGGVPTGGGLLSTISVDPDRHGAGVGRALVAAFLEELRAKGVDRCYLATDRLNNDRTNRFYIAAGWMLDCVYKTYEGREMNRYVFHVNVR